jgi:sugar lactone lactonase YvrE
LRAREARRKFPGPSFTGKTNEEQLEETVMKMRSRRAVHLGSMVALVVFAASAFAQPVVTKVMGNLDNPRGMAFGPEGALYVTEAGRGGPAPCWTNPAGETRCYGPTGAITRLWRGVQERIATGLPSGALAGGFAAGGPNDIAFQGRGGAYIPISLGGDEATRTALGPAGHFLGTLIHMAASGQWRVVADVLAHEVSANPAGPPIDSNPFGVLAEADARLVVDAGGNSLLRVAANGDISTVAVFPSRPVRNTDSVPTSVVIGPDSAYYVGELTGVPFAPGAANIYRVVPGAAPAVYLSGFKTIMDIAFGPDGSLYVVENASGAFFSGPGRLLRVAPDGTRTTIVPALDRPTSVVVGPDGALYVTNKGITPGEGEVLKVELQ